MRAGFEYLEAATVAAGGPHHSIARTLANHRSSESNALSLSKGILRVGWIA
jgi:hypothetical protein